MGRSSLVIIQSFIILYAGWWLTSLPGWELFGIGLMFLGLISLVKGMFLFISYKLHIKHQIDLLRDSRRISGAHGTSRLARKDDEFIKEMSKSASGFYLGSLGKVMLFYDPFKSGNGHMLTYAPSRTGKTISVIIPALLHWFDGSIFITDVKGELAAITSAYRKSRGHNVVIFNPFNIAGLPSQCFNPLGILIEDILHNKGNNIHDLCRLIAYQLVAERANDMGDGIFFRNGARRLIIAFLLYLAVFEAQSCNLPYLRKLLFSSNEKKLLISKEMQETDAFSGLLHDYGNILEEMLAPEYIKTYGAFRDNAISALEIYDAHGQLGKSVSVSDFSLSQIIDKKTTLYLVMPESKLETHGAALGLIASLLLEVIASNKKPKRIMMLMEEMGNLGRLPNLSKALSLLPAKGVRLWMIFQSRRQPMEIYGQQMAGLIEEQSSLVQAWSIRSQSDQKIWSVRSGKKTVKSKSLSRDQMRSDTPWRLNIQERAHPVISIDEIASMDSDMQLIAIDGKPVIKACKLAYFQIQPWRKIAAPDPVHGKNYPKNHPVRHWLGDKS